MLAALERLKPVPAVGVCTGPWPMVPELERGLEELAGRFGNGPEEGVTIPELSFPAIAVTLSLFADPEKID